MIKTKNIGKYAYYTTLALSYCWISSEALAVDFNLDTGVKAALDPIVDALKAHWGKGVLMDLPQPFLVKEMDAKEQCVLVLAQQLEEA